MNNLTQTQQTAKQAYLERQQAEIERRENILAQISAKTG